MSATKRRQLVGIFRQQVAQLWLLAGTRLALVFHNMPCFRERKLINLWAHFKPYKLILCFMNNSCIKLYNVSPPKNDSAKISMCRSGSWSPLTALTLSQPPVSDTTQQLLDPTYIYNCSIQYITTPLYVAKPTYNISDWVDIIFNIYPRCVVNCLQ